MAQGVGDLGLHLFCFIVFFPLLYDIRDCSNKCSDFTYPCIDISGKKRHEIIIIAFLATVEETPVESSKFPWHFFCFDPMAFKEVISGFI